MFKSFDEDSAVLSERTSQSYHVDNSMTEHETRSHQENTGKIFLPRGSKCGPHPYFYFALKSGAVPSWKINEITRNTRSSHTWPDHQGRAATRGTAARGICAKNATDARAKAQYPLIHQPTLQKRHTMWITFIATGVAAAVCLSVVNLASEINRIRDVRVSPPVEYNALSKAPRLEQPQTQPESRVM
jgi:hypothetical protein